MDLHSVAAFAGLALAGLALVVWLATRVTAQLGRWPSVGAGLAAFWVCWRLLKALEVWAQGRVDAEAEVRALARAWSSTLKLIDEKLGAEPGSEAQE